MNFISHDGAIYPSGAPVLSIGNRSFKWGDGVFETIRVVNQKIPLAHLHFERLFTSMKMLQMNAGFSADELAARILELCKMNACLQSARVRLAVYRNDEGGAGYSIEATSLDGSVQGWNEKGWTLGIYPHARKAIDAFANIKSASFLPYLMASLFAKENGWDDVILLNTEQSVCDSSKANIFLLRGGEFYTPPLSSGCISGVMRKWLIDTLHANGHAVHQQALSEQDLFEAEECFLTNALFGIRWVETYRDKKFSSSLTRQVYQKLVPTIFP